MVRLYHAVTGRHPSPRFHTVSLTDTRIRYFFFSIPRGVRDAVLLLTIYASILIFRHVVEPVEPVESVESVEPVEPVEPTEQAKESSITNSSSENNSAEENESHETYSKLMLFIKLFNQR